MLEPTQQGEIKMRKRRGAVTPLKQEYLGLDEVAAMTGTSPWFWRRKAYDGTVGSVNLGRRLLIPRAEIERFIKAGSRARLPKSEPAKVAEARVAERPVL
jgi:excisionase family DNA binding protein